MDLYDRAPVALLQHERHVRGARTALIRRDDHAETALSCEFQRLLLLDAELGAEDMHGGALVDWLEDRPRLTHDPVKSEAILARKRGCQDDLKVVPARAPSSAARRAAAGFIVWRLRAVGTPLSQVRHLRVLFAPSHNHVRVLKVRCVRARHDCRLVTSGFNAYAALALAIV